MAAVSTSRTRATPTVSFATLAKIMGPTTPVGQATLLRGTSTPPTVRSGATRAHATS